MKRSKAHEEEQFKAAAILIFLAMSAALSIVAVWWPLTTWLVSCLTQ